MSRVMQIKHLFKPIAVAWLLVFAASGYAEVVDRVVAIVNDDVITLSELNEAVEPYANDIRRSGMSPGEEEEKLLKLRHELLDKLIENKLTEQESKRLDVQVQDEDVAKRLETIKKEQFLTDEELRKALAKQGYTMEGYRDKIKEQMLRFKLFDREIRSKIAITEDEIRDFYEAHKEMYDAKTYYHLRSIVVRVPPGATEGERSDALARSASVVEALRSGMSFEEAAQRYSEDPTGIAGGDLGTFALGELSQEVREAVGKLKAGELSPVLETRQGYQLFKVESVEERPGKSLEEARPEIQDEIYRKLAEEKIHTWLNSLREQAYIKIIN